MLSSPIGNRVGDFSDMYIFPITGLYCVDIFQNPALNRGLSGTLHSPMVVLSSDVFKCNLFTILSSDVFTFICLLFKVLSYIIFLTLCSCIYMKLVCRLLIAYNYITFLIYICKTVRLI